jgi:hypothetical protein
MISCMYHLNYKQTNKYLYILSEAIEVTIGDTYFSGLIIQWVLTLRQQNLQYYWSSISSLETQLIWPLPKVGT